MSRIGFVILLFLALSSGFLLSFSAAKQRPFVKKASASSGTSAIFPVQGNVYPLGYYSVSLKIGNPPKVFDLDIDSGSDLTWVQCDAPCTGCTKPRDSLYKPKNNVLRCADPICSAVPPPGNQPCNSPTEQCDYKVDYADHGSSLGVLVMDSFPLKFTNGSTLGPRLAFGCGYDQEYKGHGTPPPTAGVIGLGKGKAGILSQLSQLGLTRNVVSHCFSERGGGYLFFGDDFVPSSGISWIPISTKSPENYYLSGPAELYFNGKPAGPKGLDVIFDSGSSYTYLNSQAYEAVVNLVKNSLNGSPLKNASDDPSLPLCWKGNKAFKTVKDAKRFFTPFALSFTNAKNAQLQIPPEAYLIVSKHGNACLGILNGAEVGLGKLNIVGDISMQGKMVIYDNEKQQIGWGAVNCDRPPNVEGEYDEDILQPSCAVNFGIAEENSCSSGFFYK
ncbi:aspartic proteinase Asp1-like isoform X2 [Humulus lupulus]|uniref:aspartic proteinase Asp1-like isoform X2 n=1 Tax=Humulus lupulus TaxID=3486 RepID=UPI002B4117B3|nr:aspartic proteinase Asp1-like isoform X2 [Humulus lupulus]